ncbi:PH domain-containing protein [archaeon]|nr:PH domain-containing protein [archaeon]NCQ51973.1 PH domain-containing protein [archaeon]
MEDNEELIWQDSSSQILNFFGFSISSILIGVSLIIGQFYYSIAFFAIPILLLFILWNYLVIKNTKYKLTTQRIIMQVGVFNKITDEIELYRVKDHRLEQPFIQRLFGLGNVVLITSDQINSEVRMIAIKNAPELRESIRKLVEARRITRGVREFDTN